jgi:4-amino-4-deoxy-L-arabinose transferase-like glycosyltransferase
VGVARPSKATLVALLLICAVAGWLRFATLGTLSFWADEFPHAVAARSLIHDGKPELPSGNQYRRALAQTVAVSISMRAFGEDETAARLPSAVVGFATVPLIWLAMRRRFGDLAGIAAAAALAVMPLHVAHSRSARFYAAFVLAYGTAALLGTRALTTRSWRIGVAAIAAFVLAMELQVEAALLVAPLLLSAVVAWRTSHEAARRRFGRVLLVLVAAGVAALAIVALVPGWRDEATRLLRHPVPGVEFGFGFHASTFARLFGLVSWWAWIPLAPLVLAGLRRAGSEGLNLGIQLLVPLLIIGLFFRPVDAAGIEPRYLLQLVPFLAAQVGVGVAEGLRRARRTAAGTGTGKARERAGAGVLGAVVVAGVLRVFALPGAAHPGRVIHRPDWNAAARVVEADGAAGDALLSTSPLALAWTVGRCGDWLRTREDAAPFMRGDRDLYCGSALVPDAAGAEAYITAHAAGWVLAEPAAWERYVDPAARAVIERRARRVDAGDRTILLWRWG